MENYRILAKDCYQSSNTRTTGLNNNDLIIGPSGAGKTRSYVIPNILQCSESMIIADVKSCLLQEVGSVLEAEGYHVIHMDFKDLHHAYGYNPLDYIRYDRRRKKYSEQDILTIAATLVPSTPGDRDPYWNNAARMYMACLIAYVMECLPKKEHSLRYVKELYAQMAAGNFRKLLLQRKAEVPDSYAVQLFDLFCNNERAEKTEASIQAILGEKFNGLCLDGALRMYAAPKRIDFKALGREKTAVFLTISDTDRSMDRLISLFYTQALHALCDSADHDYPDHRLAVPVRFLLDDFATNAKIPDFDKLTSVIRSREISVSIILQSITQLNSLYGEYAGATILNNCDNCLYLGGQDVATARIMAEKANKAVSSILNMPISEAYLFTRGQSPRKVERYPLSAHMRYHCLPEAQAQRNDFLCAEAE